MNDISPELKREWIVRALGIAEFTEDTEYPGLYAQVNDNIKTVVDLTVGVSAYLYDRDKKQKLINDDDGTLDRLFNMIAKAEDGVMPPPQDAQEDTPEQPDDAQTEQVPTAPENVPAVPEAPQALTSLQNNTDIVRPVVSATQAIAAWKEFQDLKKAILQPSDIKKIQGKDFMVKSAWRKFATFFNLNDKIVEETQTPHSDGNGWTWKIKVICTAPNGRFTEGVGICSTSERTFAHLEHDTYATAHTRAKNRAISDMVAAGEVSAEEVSA